MCVSKITAKIQIHENVSCRLSNYLLLIVLHTVRLIAKHSQLLIYYELTLHALSFFKLIGKIWMQLCRKQKMAS